MADLSDVLGAIAGVLAGAFYPDGTAAPSAIEAGVNVRAGWPPANVLKEALAQQRVLITVFPPENLERSTTRAMSQWLKVDPPVHTVTAVTTDETVTIGGTATVGQNVGLIYDEATLSYPVQNADTPASIAAALAMLITAAGRSASSAGPVLTVPGTHRLVARVGGTARLVKEVERTDRNVMVSVWAPTSQLRTAAGRIVRARLSDPKFIALVDGSGGWIRYERTNDWDDAERADLYRRDLSYWVEYGQYDTTDAFEVILPQNAVQPARVDGAVVGPSLTTTA